METLAKRLKEKRTAKKMTQLELSNKLNINRITYQGYESGRHNPDIETLVKIANELETSLDYLTGRF